MGKQISITDFLRVFDGLDSSMAPAKIIELILKNTDYFGYLRQNYDPKEADGKIENVKEFLVSAQMFERKVASYELTSFTPDGPPDDPFCDSSTTLQPSLENYLYEIALLQEKLQQNENDDKVQMMTLHAAKGLEFDAVIITGLDEGLLPSSRSLNVSEALEEERRLFYVGITRAQEYLLLFSASYRNSYGQIVEQVASRFLSEIPSKLVHKVDFEKMLGMQITEIIEAWIFGKMLTNSVMTFSNTTHSNEAFSNTTYPNRSSSGATHSNRPHSNTRTPRSQASHSVPKSNIRPGQTNQPARPECVRSAYTEGSPNGRRAELQKFEVSSMDGWKNGGIVEHKKFGQGVIIKVEKSTQDFYLTVAFKCGQKKLLASYVSKANV